MPDAVDQISYEDLYARREQGNWRATEIDFSVDREQWQNEFSAFERHAALWNYAIFFHGVDVVTDALCATSRSTSSGTSASASRCSRC